nr:polysaccharide biosynthesis protein [Bacilli bacterium]
MSAKSFLKGAFILAFATILSKMMGSIYTIALQNLIGDRGMGLYQMAYPVYAMLLIITTAGFPIAIAKFVSEYHAIGDEDGARRIYRVSLMMVAMIGFVVAISLFVSAPIVAKWSGDPEATLALRAIAPALFTVPIVSAMRSYFQGWQWMTPTAISQIVEQLIRVVTILVGAYLLLRLGYGIVGAASMAAFGAVVGSLGGFIVMVIVFIRKRIPTRTLRRTEASLRLPKRLIVMRMIHYALPVSLGALMIPLISAVDAFTVTNMLKSLGLSQMMATQQFGLLAGRAFKLLMLPGALASSVAAALLPFVSVAHALGNQSELQRRVRSGLQVAVFMALPASLGMMILAKPIDIALFKNAQGMLSIQITSMTILLSVIEIVLMACLQGIGAVYAPLVGLIGSFFVKITGNLLLIRFFGIDGAAFATLLSYLFATGYGFMVLQRRTKLRLKIEEDIVKPLTVTLIMGAFLYAMYDQWTRFHFLLSPRWNALFITGICVFVGIGLYVFLLIVIGLIKEKELAAVPKVGPYLIFFCHRIGLFVREV